MSSINPQHASHDGKRNRSEKGGSSRSTTTSLPSVTPVPWAADRKLITYAALRQSLTGGEFIDVKFYAFSRRDAKGRVDRPMPVYANSAILKVSAKYFESLLSGGYKEDKPSPLDEPFPSDGESSTEEYEYLSDSDLDDKEVLVTPLVDEWDEDGLNVSQEADKLSVHDPPLPADEENVEIVTGRYGRVIVLPDIAYQTLKALVFYLYTNEISFAPLKSHNEERPRRPSLAYGAPLCSPKSMYRVADKYGLDELKQLAAADIQSKLTQQNILPELFSTVPSMFPDIRRVQVKFACNEAVFPHVVAGIPEWVNRACAGELRHCASVLTEIFEELSSQRIITCEGCNRALPRRLYKCCQQCQTYCGVEGRNG